MRKTLHLFIVIIVLCAIIKPQSVHAQSGLALSLPGASNGSNSNMTLPAMSSKITGFPFTVEMWVKPSSWVSYGGFWSDRSVYATTLQFDNNSTNHYIRCDFGGTSRLITFPTTATCNNGAWNHLAYTVYADSAVVELNGTYYTSKYTTKTWNPLAFSAISYIGWDNPVGSGQYGRTVAGLFDEIRFWNTGRSRAQIEANKNSSLTGNETGLVAYYNFDDNTTNDKTSNGFNGTVFGGSLKDPNIPVITLSEQALVLEIEKDFQPHPLYITCENLTNNIVVSTTAGFSIDKATFTPNDFINGANQIKVIIDAPTANIGDTGKVYISYTLGGINYKFDSVRVTPVPTYDRNVFTNKPSGLVIGNHSTLSVPALEVLNENIDATQLYLLRPVNPGVSDSLYYIVQDGDYRMLRKSSNDWDTEFGSPSNEAIWKFYPQSNGTTRIINIVRNAMSTSQNSLGATALVLDTRLSDNNVFSVDATASPYCEWFIQNYLTLLDPNESHILSVSLSQGLLSTNFDPNVTTYDVLAPADADSITVTGTPKTNLASIDNNGGLLSPGSSVVLSCVSGNSSSTTEYTFNSVTLGFSDWAARGETSVSRSVPSQWGWKCPNIIWASANSIAAGTVRYMDNPAGYYTTGVLSDSIPYEGRIMYTRWDGTDGVSGVYSFPMMMTEGKNYTLTGKYAWNSVIPAGVTTAQLTFGINTNADNSGVYATMVDSVVNSTDLLHLHNFMTDFQVPSTGLYYFTIQSNAAIMGAVADLVLTDGISAINNSYSQGVFASVDNKFVIIHGTVAGDKIVVYNTSGQMIIQLVAGSDITKINLNSGIYLIRVNQIVLKVTK
jgi:hypothetical protein